MIHTVEGFGVVNKAEVDVFLALSCFFDYPADIGNLISGSSAFSKTSLNSSQGVLKVNSAAAHDLILVEVDGKHPRQVPMCAYPTGHPHL